MAQVINEAEDSFYIWFETKKKQDNTDSFVATIEEGIRRCDEMVQKPGIVRAVLMGAEGKAYEAFAG